MMKHVKLFEDFINEANEGMPWIPMPPIPAGLLKKKE
jgi:hypothetical protein